MADFSWVPQELEDRFSYKNGKLVASCEVCDATKVTAGRGSVLKDIAAGKIDRFRFCSMHGDFGYAKPSPEDMATWPDKHKRCRRCLEVKPFADFHKHEAALFGTAVECKECRKPASKAEWQARTFEQTMLASSKYRAKKLGLPHTITIDDIVIPEFCPVLKHNLVLERNHPYRPSLDQIEPRKGYTPDNIIVMSDRANRLKNNIEFSESLALTVWMYESSVGEKFHYE